MKSSIFNFWQPTTTNNSFNTRRIKSFVLNFGPQHPAAHGVLRLVVQLNGELVEKADSHVGFLHRGTEKLMESRTYLKSLPYFDRLDYVSMMAQEHAFCLTIEDLLGTTSYTANYVQIRVLFDELIRIFNHLLALSTHALDVGNMSPVFWAFEERERIMEFYERVSGARMHTAFYRPNDIDWSGLNHQFFADLALFARDCFKSLTEIFAVLVTNRIWKSRLVYIGAVNQSDVLGYGATGPVVRSTGIKKDLRLLRSDTYSFYWYLSFRSFLGKHGDAYDRFLVRMREMYESVNIIFQIINHVTSNTNLNGSNRYKLHNLTNLHNPQIYNSMNYNTKYNDMETLITHFKNYSEGMVVPKGFSYKAVEAPKGEFGTSIVSDGTPQPYRCKIRTPAYHHTQIMSRMVQGHFFADLITVLGSQDIVFGDVDR